MPTAVIKLNGMTKNPEMQDKALEIATLAYEECNSEEEIATFIKQAFEKEYGHTWHCFVGRNFAAFVTHQEEHFIYFYLGQLGIMLFSTV